MNQLDSVGRRKCRSPIFPVRSSSGSWIIDHLICHRHQYATVPVCQKIKYWIYVNRFIRHPSNRSFQRPQHKHIFPCRTRNGWKLYLLTVYRRTNIDCLESCYCVRRCCFFLYYILHFIINMGMAIILVFICSFRWPNERRKNGFLKRQLTLRLGCGVCCILNNNSIFKQNNEHKKTLKSCSNTHAYIVRSLNL